MLHLISTDYCNCVDKGLVFCSISECSMLHVRFLWRKRCFNTPKFLSLALMLSCLARARRLNMRTSLQSNELCRAILSNPACILSAIAFLPSGMAASDPSLTKIALSPPSLGGNGPLIQTIQFSHRCKAISWVSPALPPFRSNSFLSL